MSTVRSISIPGAALVFAGLGLLVLPASAAVFVDDFSGASLNTAVWLPGTTGLSSVSQTGGRLLLSMDGANTGDLGATARSQSKLVGNFDVSVDLSLIQWPGHDAAYTALGFSALDGQHFFLERIGAGSPYGEAYVADFNGQGIPKVSTSDLATSFRVTRSGTLVTGYYKTAAGSWQVLKSLNGTGAPDLQWLLALWSYPSTFGHQTVTVAFDNFTITSGTVNPPPAEPASILLLALGGWAAVGRRRR